MTQEIAKNYEKITEGKLPIIKGDKEEIKIDTKLLLEKKKIFSYSKIDDYFIIVKIFVIDIQKDHSSLVEFSNIKLDDMLNDKLFHEKNLQRLPEY